MQGDENKELLFARTLESVKKTAKEQGSVIAKEQVEETFAGLSLSKEQLALVFDYLKKHRIGIGEPAGTDDYLTREDTDYLELYKQELSELEEINGGEREAVTLGAMAGDPSAKKRLIEICLPQVVEIAKLYAGQGVSMEDLIGEGNVALAAGAELLGCLEKPSEAQGMLGKMIMDAMEESIGENGREDEKQRAVLERINRIHARSKELAESLLRKVTAEELAAETDITREEIEDAIRLSGGKMEYIEEEKNAR